MTKIKFCGLRRMQDVILANELEADYVGFVFARKSRRYIEAEQAARLKKELRPGTLAVGVFVDEKPETIAALLEKGIIDLAQLHGNETEADVKALQQLTGRPVIQAIRIRDRADVGRAKESPAQMILLDAQEAGSGRRFDWSLICGLDRPFILAGGLDAENVREAIDAVHPYAVDVSSGIETDGFKDPEKMRRFARAVRGQKKERNGS